MSDELTPERLKQIEGRWKSDVDLKLDRLVRFADKSEAFVDMLMQREVQRVKMRQAIIEKTLAGLLWGLIVFVGVAAWHSIKAALK